MKKERPDRFTVPAKGITVKPMSKEQKAVVASINKELAGNKTTKTTKK